MALVRIDINGEKIEAEEGARLLDVLLEHDVYVPHLCALEGEKRPYAACRLCFVEVDGQEQPQCACLTNVKEGLSVDTRGTKAFELAKGVFSLHLFEHRVDCVDCALGNSGAVCEIRRAARYFGMPLHSVWRSEVAEEVEPDESAGLKIDHASCVLCGKCVRICKETGHAFLGMANRGARTCVIADSRVRRDRSVCIECRACMTQCPTASISL